MPLVNLPLYCTNADVFDYLGSEGAQLRLDDHVQATGQTIQATADALVGATAIGIAPLVSRLYRGTVLVFDGAGQDVVSEVFLTSTVLPGSVLLAVTPLTQPVNAQSVAFDSGVNVALYNRIVKARQYGTAQVKLYCCPRYDDSALQTSWSVNRWSTVLSSRWLAKRRAQACPQGIESDYQETIEELRRVRVSMINIEDIGTRTVAWPFLSNCTVDIGYDTAKTRVERPISEATPTNYGQYVDWGSEGWVDW